MTDKEIIKALECCLNEDCDNCPNCCGCYCIENLMSYALDYIRRQREQFEATIAGQETLQKSLAEKDREVAELNSDLKLLRNDYDYLKKKLDETIERNKRLRDKVVRLTAEKDSLIKTFCECQAEAVRAFAERLKNEAVTRLHYGAYLELKETECVEIDEIDKLLKEMAGDTE